MGRNRNVLLLCALRCNPLFLGPSTRCDGNPSNWIISEKSLGIIVEISFGKNIAEKLNFFCFIDWASQNKCLFCISKWNIIIIISRVAENDVAWNNYVTQYSLSKNELFPRSIFCLLITSFYGEDGMEFYTYMQRQSIFLIFFFQSDEHLSLWRWHLSFSFQPSFIFCLLWCYYGYTGVWYSAVLPFFYCVPFSQATPDDILISTHTTHVIITAIM